MNQSNIRLEKDGSVDKLLCPKCGFEYMHHGKIRVWSRDREDAGGISTTINGAYIDDENGVEKPATVSINRLESDQGIPGRRDALTIDFTCENGCTSTLMIEQHKGETLLYWA